MTDDYLQVIDERLLVTGREVLKELWKKTKPYEELSNDCTVETKAVTEDKNTQEQRDWTWKLTFVCC